MTMIDLYEACCPQPGCSACIQLLETTLAQIIHSRLHPDTGEPFLMFVCSDCKHGFRWDRWKNPPVAKILEPLRTPAQKYPIVYSVAVECANNNCQALVELFSVRDHGTTEVQWKDEMGSWILDGLFCANGHQLEIPDPNKVKFVSHRLPPNSGKPS